MIKWHNLLRILFSNKNHWVCVAGKYHCQYKTHGGEQAVSDKVLYDSLNKRRTDPELAKQLKLLFPHEHRVDKVSGKLHVLVKKTQRQTSELCGFYAAAYETTLYSNIDPESLVFDD